MTPHTWGGQIIIPDENPDRTSSDLFGQIFHKHMKHFRCYQNTQVFLSIDILNAVSYRNSGIMQKETNMSETVY